VPLAGTLPTSQSCDSQSVNSLGIGPQAGFVDPVRRRVALGALAAMGIAAVVVVVLALVSDDRHVTGAISAPPEA
jgi:hypothetical protein